MSNSNFHTKKMSILAVAAFSLYFPLGIAADIDVNERHGAQWSNSSDDHILLVDNNYINKTDKQTLFTVSNQGKIALNRVTATVNNESDALIALVTNGELNLSTTTFNSVVGGAAVTLVNGVLELNNHSKIVSNTPSLSQNSGKAVAFSGNVNRININNSTIEGNDGLVADSNGRATINLINGAKVVASDLNGSGVSFNGGTVSVSGSNSSIAANSYGVREAARIGTITNTTVNVTNGASISATNGTAVALNNTGGITVSGAGSSISGRSGITAQSLSTVNISSGAQVTGSTGNGISLSKGGTVTVQDANSQVSGKSGISSAANSDLTLNVSKGGQVIGKTDVGVSVARGNIKVADSGSIISGTMGIRATDRSTILVEKGGQVAGRTGSGMSLSKGGAVTVQDANSQVSGKSGISSAADSDLTLNVSKGGQVIGETDVGVSVARGNINVADSGSIISGTVGIRTTDRSTILVEKGGQVTGRTGSGISLSQAGTVTVQDANSQISGKNGISSAADSDLTLNVRQGGQVIGETDAGVSMTRGSINVADSGSMTSGTTGLSTLERSIISVEKGAKITGSIGSGISLAKGGMVNIEDANSQVSGNVGINSGKDADMTLNISKGARVTGESDVGVRVGRGHIIITDSGSTISGTTGVNATGRSIISISNGAKVIGNTISGIHLARGGNVNLTDANSQVSGKTGISSGTQSSLMLNISNGSSVTAETGVGVSVAQGSITLADKGSTISGSTGVSATDRSTVSVSNGAKIIGQRDAAIDLRNGGQVVVAGKGTVISGDTGITSQGSDVLDLQLSDGATILGDKYGVSLQDGTIILNGNDSHIQSEQTGVQIKGNAQIELQQGAKIIAKQDGVQIQNSDKTLLNLIGEGAEIIGKVALKLFASQDTTVNLEQGGLLSALGGSVIETENQGDISLTINGHDQIIHAQEAHGINLTGQQLGNNSIALNNLTINSIEPTAHALRIDRNITAENQLKLTNSRFNTLDNSTILLKQGNLDLILDRSVVAGNQRVLEVAQNNDTGRATLHLTQQAQLLGDVVNDSVAYKVNISLDNHSIFKGTATNIGDLAIQDATSQWYVRADSTLDNLINNGRIYFRESPDPSGLLNSAVTEQLFKSIQLKKNYTADKGWLEINTVLGGEQSATDKLMVGGNTAGTTFVKINNIAGKGGRVVNGIEIVKVAGQSDGVFVQDKRYLAGGYEYTLYKGKLNQPNDGNWSLYSVAHPYIGAYLANRVAATTMFNQTLTEQITAARTVGRSQPNDLARAMWLNTTGARINSRAADRDLKLATHIRSVQLGGDVAQGDTDSNHHFKIGVMFGQGKSHTRVDNQRHYNNLNTLNSSGKVEGYNVGAYTILTPNLDKNSGVYFGSSLQYGWFKNDIQTISGEAANYNSKTFSVASEMAYGLILSEQAERRWILKPQARVRFYSYHANDQETNLGNDSRLTRANMSGVATLVGVNFSGKTADTRGVEPFVEVNWYYDSAADKAIQVGQNDFNQSVSKSMYEINAGLNLKLTANFESWLHVGGKVASSKRDYQEIRGSLGIKFNW